MRRKKTGYWCWELLKAIITQKIRISPIKMSPTAEQEQSVLKGLHGWKHLLQITQKPKKLFNHYKIQ